MTVLENCFWSGYLGNLRAADVGDLQVRTRSRDDYELNREFGVLDARS